MPIDQITNPAAAAAYTKTARALVDKQGMEGGDVSFGDILKSTAQNAVKTMRAGETMAAQAVIGKAELTDVVQAINAADLTLQTVVAVRDKMIAAYQDIMRMPI